ncbi:hypothetical protein CVD28_25640 [Bacillus sp. M6-12]|uniref:hypothetical protein n=1 Tax=Bacillus sp. M6-12 TaxID=2054166 RepID=UPI000C772C2E|nr:hypothetical protein [Bacillus sp. M6-12]PLS14906.1 hypothetical protein CVD28_25640 [Bacillus sp. M6-12]
MTKEQIQLKLLNSVDYFHTAAGKFETLYVHDDNSESTSVVEYKVSIKNKIGGYDKGTDIYPDNKGRRTHEAIFNDQKVWLLRDDSIIGKIFQEHDHECTPDQGTLTINDVFMTNEAGVIETRLRERPPVGDAGLTLFPYEMVAIYTRDNDRWKIEKQNEEVLGHNTIVLTGKPDKKAVRGMRAETFRFWADKDSGVLVKYETYDINGNITSYLHPESLHINIPIDTKEFIPKLEGYKKLAKRGMEYKDPREKDIKVLAIADDEATKNVLNILKKHIPFFYEFTNRDLQLFSASYEKYIDDKHGYVSYSYKKDPDEVGSGTKLLFTRCYDKDTVVRSWGEFDTEKGDRIDQFKINDIEWESFKIHDNKDTHFIGRKGDYIYEIVSQNISYEEVRLLLKSFNLAFLN